MTAVPRVTLAQQGSRGVWLATVLCLGAMAVSYLWFPLWRITSYQEITYNEGWNAYWQQMAARGSKLYALPPDLSAINYPPISFYVIGLIGNLTGDVIEAGRWLSVISIAGIAALAGLIAAGVCGRWRPGCYASMLAIIWLASFATDRVGMNDPQLFGLAFSVLGLYLYARRPHHNLSLAASAAAFAVSLFIKQNLIAFPAAVGLHLLIARAYRSLGVWLASLTAVSGALLLLTLFRDGSYFGANVMTGRSYSFAYGWEHLAPYLVRHQVAIAAALAWSIWNGVTRPRNLLVIAFAFAHSTGYLFAGGDGVDRNVLFDSVVTLAMVTAVAFADIEPVVLRLRYGQWLLPIVAMAPALACLALLPAQLRHDRILAAATPEIERQTSEGVALLKSREGPALCENLLLCFEAGKPMRYDPFYVESQVRIGKLAEADVVRLIESGRFRTLEIELRPGETLQAGDRLRFTANMVRAMLEHYRPKMQAMNFVVLVPKDEP